MTLSEKLVTLRKEKGLTQIQAAEALKVSRQAISRWEVGTAVPSIDNYKALATLYNVSLESLIQSNQSLSAMVNTSCEQKEKNKFPKSAKIVIICLCVFLCALSMLFIHTLSQKNNSVGQYMTETEVSDFEADGGFDLNW